jgi:2-oxoglutarate ferredoxin oxidoreductase subunit gamma
MTNKDIIIVNSSVPITYQEKENTSGSYFIPATYIADTEIENIKTANMVIVGSLIRILEMHDISLQSIDKRSFTLKNMLSACEKAFNQKPQFVEINKKAIQTGYNFVKQSIF